MKWIKSILFCVVSVLAILAIAQLFPNNSPKYQNPIDNWGQKAKNTSPESSVVVNQGAHLRKESEYYLININRAGVAQIATALHGVGVKKAKAIVKYRQQYGPFKSIDSVKNVKGIGEIIVERNRKIIVIN